MRKMDLCDKVLFITASILFMITFLATVFICIGILDDIWIFIGGIGIGLINYGLLIGTLKLLIQHNDDRDKASIYLFYSFLIGLPMCVIIGYYFGYRGNIDTVFGLTVFELIYCIILTVHIETIKKYFGCPVIKIDRTRDKTYLVTKNCTSEIYTPSNRKKSDDKIDDKYKIILSKDQGVVADIKINDIV